MIAFPTNNFDKGINILLSKIVFTVDLSIILFPLPIKKNLCQQN